MVNTSAAGAVSVIMPIYNEEATLDVILGHVLRRPEVGQVVAVDDGSRDRSGEILSRIAAGDSRVEIIRHPRNLGKGAALRNAIDRINRPYALVQDADLEYDPRDYPELLAPLLESRTMLVYGVRGFLSHSSYSFWFVLGNKGVTLATNLLFGCFISDMETGYKVMRSDLWRKLRLEGGSIRCRTPDHRAGASSGLPDPRGADPLLRTRTGRGQFIRHEGWGACAGNPGDGSSAVGSSSFGGLPHARPPSPSPRPGAPPSASGLSSGRSTAPGIERAPGRHPRLRDGRGDPLSGARSRRATADPGPLS